MSEINFQQLSEPSTRRQFLGGVGAALAAAAYTADVPESATAQVTSGDDSLTQSVSSPDGNITVTVDVSDGVPSYSVDVGGSTYVTSSGMGFDFQNQPAFGATDGSSAAITVTGSESGTATETWDPVWGQFDSVSEDYEHLTLGLAESADPGRSGNLEFRVFNDGIGFRFGFDQDFAANSGNLVITAENTAFNFAGDYTSWWIKNRFAQPPGEPGRFEDEYTESALSATPSGTRSQSPSGTTVQEGVHTPLTVDTGDGGPYLSVHEADLDDYATMSLAPQGDGSTDFTAELAPLPDGSRVAAQAPHATPWRTIQIGDTPGDLVESSLIPLLNEEMDTSVLPSDGNGVDTDWITPRMYVGIWWAMIAGSANWEYLSDGEVANPAQTIHGARTERMKRYMRFASEHDIESVLVEGWNQGWSSYGGSASGNALEMGINDSYPDFDVPEVTDYGANLSTPVEMTMHNETSGNLFNYEDEILNAGIFTEYENAGIRSIKTGYVNNAGLYNDPETPDTPTHNHHSQVAVNHHRTVIQRAAQNRQLLEVHEGIKPTGERRTYPNVAAREVVKAQEYDGFGALGSDVGRDHHVELPFTRMLAGPTSYQPGIFDITFNDGTGGRVQTTRAKQLAMYPAYHGGIQMAADRIEAYVDDSLEVGEFVQAAAGTLDGMITADKYRNAFGTNYVPVDPNREASGSGVSFTVTDVPEAGTYDLHLRYASDGSENTQRVIDYGSGRATLAVNGSTRTIEPPFSGGWDEWDVFTTSVELTAGDNTVTIELNYDDADGFTGDVGGFNLNSVGVTQPGLDAPFPATYTSLSDQHVANENFDAEREFKYIEDVPPGGWDETRVLDSAIGEYIVIARRKGAEWYVGAMNDDNGRAFQVTLDFLQRQTNGWKMEMYTDAYGTTVDADPTGVRTTESIVGAGDTVTLSAARGGGTALRLAPATASEASNLRSYQRPAQELSVEIDQETTVTETFARATGSNNTAFISGQTVRFVVDGTVESVENVRLAPNSGTQTVEFDRTFAETGEYAVEIRDLNGAPLASTTVTVTDPTTVAQFDDPVDAPDALGPGSYVNATNFADGSMDIRQFEVRETPSNAIFEFTVGALNDPYNAEANGTNAFSPQWFFVWLRDPERSGGNITEAGTLGDPGLNADFESAWHYRIDANGFGDNAIDHAGAQLTDANGDPVSPTVRADKSANTVTLQVPKSAINGTDLWEMEFVAGVHSESRGEMRTIAETAAEHQFGGLNPDAAENAPRLMDLITPTGVTNADALGHSATRQATLPFTPMHDADIGGAARVATFSDESGDDDGWGPVTYPEAGKLADPGSLDLTRLDVYEDESRYYFAARFAEALDNPEGLAAGFTRPHIRLHLRDPSQGGTVTEGGIGCHPYGNKQIIESEGWHRLIDIQATYKAIQDTGFNPLATESIGRSVLTRGDTILFSTPKEHVPADIRDVDLNVLVYGWQNNTSGIMKIEERQYAATNDSGQRIDLYRPNTQASNYYHTNVVDIMTGSQTDQSSVLDPAVLSDTAGGTFAEYQIPLLPLGDRANTIREALAGNGPLTASHFREVQRAYENGEVVAGTGGLVPTYADVREIAAEVSDE